MTSAAKGVWCVVVAAGSGSRFGTHKQFESLGSQRVIDHSLRTAAEACEGVVAVLPAAAIAEGIVVPDADLVVAGGDTRTASSQAGTDSVPDSAEVILVHDAARPLASPELFARVVSSVRAGADAVVPVVPVVDSIRHVNGSVVDRDELRAVQTPQGFRAALLREALASTPEATDDAQAAELTGAAVQMVDGEPTNVKITTPADLLFVRAVLDERAPGARTHDERAE